MNFLSPFPISGYSTKVAGIGISVIGLLFITWVQISGQPINQIEFNFEEQVTFGIWIFTFGLYLMAFSKEKVDDERVQRIRQVALRSSFQILVGVLLAAQITSLIVKTSEIDFSILPVTFALVFYHLIFYVALIRNPEWAYKEVTVTENFQMNKKFYYLYALALVMMIAIMIWLKYFNN